MSKEVKGDVTPLPRRQSLGGTIQPIGPAEAVALRRCGESQLDDRGEIAGRCFGQPSDTLPAVGERGGKQRIGEVVQVAGLTCGIKKRSHASGGAVVEPIEVRRVRWLDRGCRNALNAEYYQGFHIYRV